MSWYKNKECRECKRKKNGSYKLFNVKTQNKLSIQFKNSPTCEITLVNIKAVKLNH